MRSASPRYALLGAAALLVALGATSPAVALSAVAVPTTAHLRGQSSTTPRGGYTGIEAIASDDVWAVGYTEQGSDDSPLAEHYDGHSWHDVSPTPRSGTRFFNAVAGTSATNVWAAGVGPGLPGGAGGSPLIEHWDGGAWSNATLPRLPKGVLGGAVRSIDMVGSDLVWAVGSVWTATTISSAIWRWSDGNWSFATIPNPHGVPRVLYGVSTSTTTSGWAVGFTAPDRGRYHAAGLSWEGHTWSRAAVVTPGIWSQLFGVDEVASGDTWAVGTWEQSRGQWLGLLEHYTDGSWQQVTGPDLGLGVTFEAVSGDNAEDVWVVGYRETSSSQQAELTHWDGSSWTVFHGPHSGQMLPGAVATVGPTMALAVGDVGQLGITEHPFREQWNGRVWSKG